MSDNVFSKIFSTVFVVVFAILLIYVSTMETAKQTNSNGIGPLEKTVDEAPNSRCLHNRGYTIRQIVYITRPQTTPLPTTTTTTPLRPTQPPTTTTPRPTLPPPTQPRPTQPPVTLPPTTTTQKSLLDPNGPDIQYVLFQRDRLPINFQLNSCDQIEKTGVIPGIPTKIIVHGYLGSVLQPEFTLIKDAYLSNGHFNVIGIDWSALSRSYYFQAIEDSIKAVASLARLLNVLLDEGIRSSSIHIIGHGLGAHIAGLGSSKIPEKLARITALDPDIIGYFTTAQSMYKLRSTDAYVVDAIHSNLNGISAGNRQGLIDFYPNGGKITSTCPGDRDAGNKCSHGDAYKYFARSIRQPYAFKSVKCKTVRDAIMQQCFTESDVYMGRDETYIPGIYYVKV